MSQRMMIYGKKFAEIRRARFLTQEEFARRLEMSSANVRRLEQAETSGMQVKNFRKLATLTNLSPPELRQRIGVPIARDRASNDLSALQSSNASNDPAFPSALRSQSISDVTDVEHFHGVSAAHIEDRTAIGRGTTPVPAGAARRFAVSVDGDCMEPKYHDGDVVIFSIDAAEREGIIDGKNYFIQFNDGQNTFKRIFLDPDNRELLVLKCWNEKYRPRIVERSAIKLLARAIYKQTADENV